MLPSHGSRAAVSDDDGTGKHVDLVTVSNHGRQPDTLVFDRESRLDHPLPLRRDHPQGPSAAGFDDQVHIAGFIH